MADISMVPMVMVLGIGHGSAERASYYHVFELWGAGNYDNHLCPALAMYLVALALLHNSWHTFPCLLFAPLFAAEAFLIAPPSRPDMRDGARWRCKWG